MDKDFIINAGNAARFILPDEDELKELEQQQDAICQQLEQRLTDLGKSILYKQLTEVFKKKEIIYKTQLENIKNGL